uniref:Uncharacterized protein n=1 Tax=Oryza meridionalis TaxID=40149 RepID=A0A0E0DH81_9ORYZ
MEGRLLGSPERQRSVSWAACCAALDGYCPSRRGSTSRASFRRSARYGLAHSTRLCCGAGLPVSSARIPVSISSSTTPNPYTSLFTYRNARPRAAPMAMRRRRFHEIGW